MLARETREETCSAGATTRIASSGMTSSSPIEPSGARKRSSGLSSGLALLLLGACGTAEPDDGGAAMACRRDGDCGGAGEGVQCVAQLGVETPDGEPVALSCGRAVGDLGPGAACAMGEDCSSGVCLVAGTCAQPCREDGD